MWERVALVRPVSLAPSCESQVEGSTYYIFTFLSVAAVSILIVIECEPKVQISKHRAGRRRVGGHLYQYLKLLYYDSIQQQ